jgi:hypothetical protein
MNTQPITESDDVAGKRPVGTMSLAEVQRELRAYKPLTAAHVISSEVGLERIAALWARLDRLRRSPI